MEGSPEIAEQEIQRLSGHRQPIASRSSGFNTGACRLSSASTAVDYKNAGNKLCTLYKYDEAMIYYSKAISLNPNEPIFYSNRALCHIKLQQWKQALQDCRSALDLNPNLIKAHFFIGQAFAETGNFEESLKHLQRAHELAKEEKLNFGDDITYHIRLVRRRQWNKIEDESVQFEEKLKNYLVELIRKDKAKKATSHDQQEPIPSSSTSNIAATQSGATASDIAAATASTPTPSSIHADEDREGTTGAGDAIVLEAIESTEKPDCDNYIEKIESMFNDLKLKRRKRDVPDYLCGKISYEIMQDPVITPSGITYDRQDIEEHLRRVGHFDPITRQPLKASQLISNLAMKEVVDAYLSENEWALYN